jgi:hypothetical protein
MRKLDPESNVKQKANSAWRNGLYTRTHDHRALCEFQNAVIYRECMICYDILKDKEASICEGQCHFIACQSCMDRHLEESATCPGCRISAPRLKDIQNGRKVILALKEKEQAVANVVASTLDLLIKENPLYREL